MQLRRNHRFHVMLSGCYHCHVSITGMRETPPMTIQYVSMRVIFGVLSFNAALAVMVLTTPARTAEVPSACTIFPRDMWLPLRSIINRLEDEGLVVLRRSADTQDCYRVDVRDPEGQERLLVIDPVSGKIRREAKK
ncbi:MAG: PepSY domain-containing protein [Beijerinckiaceae bacterium]